MCAVEWKCLNEIANVTIGEFVHKDKQNPNAEYPVYNGGISNTGYYEDFNNTGNKIIISARGANAGYINRVFVDYWAGNSCYSISVTSNDVDWNFLFYFLKTNQRKLIGEQQKGGIPAISKKQICTFEIPIPSLAKQQEIVSQLDTFTTLISNLESELEMRRKQYEHCRNQLLDFEGVEGVEWKTLGEVCEIRGRIGFRGYTREDQVKEGEGVLSLSPGNIVNGKMDYDDSTYITWQKYEESPEIKIYNGDIIFCKTGSTVGKVAIVDQLPYKATINPQLVVLKEIKINSKFLAYSLAIFRIQSMVKALAGVGSVPNISQAKLSEIKICIPSPETQQQIVEKLDAFEQLIQSLEQEIKLRKQQYEYYREKLLTFE